MEGQTKESLQNLQSEWEKISFSERDLVRERSRVRYS